MEFDVLSLFEADSKRDVEKICSSITLTSGDLTYLVNLSNARIIEFPYLHACKYNEKVPENVHLTEKNIEAIKSNGVGKLNRDAHKTVNKLFQTPLQVKRTAAHMFYRSDHRFWHMFFFDLKDRSSQDNHWEHGSHIHYVSSLWPNLNCQDIWNGFCQHGKKAIGRHKHIRFEK